ncbi:MAG TPA: hypothetical protein VF163_16880 [Micromonosporaceae bacterium]
MDVVMNRPGSVGKASRLWAGGEPSGFAAVWRRWRAVARRAPAEGSHRVSDLVFVLLTIGAFALLAAVVRRLERL